MQDRSCMYLWGGDYGSRAFGVALGVPEVSVARTFTLVAISPRRHTLTLLAAYPTEPQTPILPSCFRTSSPTLGTAERYNIINIPQHTQQIKSITCMHVYM